MNFLKKKLYREGDVKPPELKLTSTPYCDKSYDNASLTWTFNEDATSTCLIRTSLKTEFAVCDKSWSGTFLPEGNVTIEVNARDKSRNSAPSFSYTWYNSKLTNSERKSQKYYYPSSPQ